ncbi:Hsp20/alpha crystallin family protein [Hyphomonas sp.]|uniref:Hsp20/alpha crystallin family protein n=1 Tax=Hyphomonas sp. TaxID=87 RepID=UPI000C58D5F2|nr:Hsp20/alpha crystallin family protein [Hyphomonas sp.]MAB10847.1 heat-shock protein Hsp20 [Hyphomonas sp.]MAU67977.1 heat-shock protein Hsp20 [Hyphomonas sp.]MBM59704.1 heat-shock protein Hsp20 [Hyphomonas sp.]|tara:strand:- start:203 stop:748 length:546 start_codon:yes stop_codon:yes gene_type:complete
MRIRDLIPWGRKKENAPDVETKGGPLMTTQSETLPSLAPLQSELNTLFDRFFERFEAPMLQSGFAGLSGALSGPRLDMKETDKEIEISLDLPGLDEKDVDVTLTGDVLTVRGERRHDNEREEGGYYVHERSFGSFYRTIPLPPGLDTDKAKATFKKGVLNLKVPKTAEAKRLTKRIEVKSA